MLRFGTLPGEPYSSLQARLRDSVDAGPRPLLFGYTNGYVGYLQDDATASALHSQVYSVDTCAGPVFFNDPGRTGAGEVTPGTAMVDQLLGALCADGSCEGSQQIPFQLRSQWSDTCLHGNDPQTYVYQAACDAGDEVNLWTWVGSGAWQMLRNEADGTCLHAVSSYTSGDLLGDLYLDTCDASDEANLWAWDGTGLYRQLQNQKYDDFCMHVDAASTAPGVHAYGYVCTTLLGAANTWSGGPMQ